MGYSQIQLGFAPPVRLDETYDNPKVKKHLAKYENNLPPWLDRVRLKEGEYTFSINQICWYDECHVYQELGPESPIQYRFKWTEDGKPIPNLNDDYRDLVDDSLIPQDEEVESVKEVSTENDTDDKTDANDKENDIKSQKWHLSKVEIKNMY